MNGPGLVTGSLLTGTLVFLLCFTGAESKAQPANDLFANRTVLTGTNLSIIGSNVGARKEVGEPKHAGNVGGASVWWSWTAPASGFVTISTAGSKFDTILGIYKGASVSTLSVVAYGDDADSRSTSKVVFDAAAGETYQIAVDGYDGASSSVQLNLELSIPFAPAWVLPEPYGAKVDSSKYAGKVVLLNFWATWCSPCKAELPDLVALQGKYRSAGLEIVGVDLDSSSQVLRTFLSTNKPVLNYQIVIGNDAMTTAYGGIQYLPTTFIIDRQNVIRKYYVGAQSLSTLEDAIIPLLSGNTELSYQRIGNRMILSWPNNSVAFTLESTVDLRNPTWASWPTAPSVVNGTNTVNVPMVGAQRYFRLRKSS